MDIDLSSFVRTKAEAVDFADRIGKISTQLYQLGFSLDKALLQGFGMQKKEAFLSLLREHNIQADSIQALKEFLTTIQETAQSLPVLSLTTAFQPNDQTLTLLSRWFMLNVNKQVLFEIKVDPGMIGGVAVNYQGKHVDFSITSAFQKIVTEMLTPPDKKKSAEKPIHHNPENMHL